VLRNANNNSGRSHYERSRGDSGCGKIPYEPEFPLSPSADDEHGGVEVCAVFRCRCSVGGRRWSRHDQSVWRIKTVQRVSAIPNATASRSLLSVGVCVSANGKFARNADSLWPWRQTMWVSGRDLCRAFEHAIDDERISFGVYNLVSHNPGCGGRSLRWRVTATSFVQGCWRRCPLPMVQPARRAWPGCLRSACVRLATDSPEPSGNGGSSGANRGRA